MKEAIAKVVKQSLTDLNEDFGFLPKGVALESGLVLFGESGCLSSITLVSLVSDIEEKVAQELNKDIVLPTRKP